MSHRIHVVTIRRQACLRILAEAIFIESQFGSLASMDRFPVKNQGGNTSPSKTASAQLRGMQLATERQ
jgi:hypothetical protein